MPSGNRIMVIEDDPDILDLITITLTDEAYEAYEVRGVRSGRAALELLRHWSPELILLDLDLGDMSGEAFLAACRQQALLTARVLLLSAAANVMSKLSGSRWRASWRSHSSLMA